MDHLWELQALTADARDALKAATDILTDPELPLFYRVQAYDRCMGAFRRFAERIPEAANLAIAQETARISLFSRIPDANLVRQSVGDGDGDGA